MNEKTLEFLESHQSETPSRWREEAMQRRKDREEMMSTTLKDFCSTASKILKTDVDWCVITGDECNIKISHDGDFVEIRVNGPYIKLVKLYKKSMHISDLIKNLKLLKCYRTIFDILNGERESEKQQDNNLA